MRWLAACTLCASQIRHERSTPTLSSMRVAPLRDLQDGKHGDDGKLEYFVCQGDLQPSQNLDGVPQQAVQAGRIAGCVHAV